MTSKTSKLIEITFENMQGEDVTKEVNIKRMKTKQYGRVMSVVGGLTRRVTEDEALMNTVKTQIFKIYDEDWKDQETGQLLESIRGKLQGDLIGSFGFALEFFPDELTKLIAAASNLSVEVIEALEIESLFDVVEAVIEVNDIKRLQELGKKFSNNLKTFFQTKENKEKQREHLQSVTQ